jgi:site-specific DNA-adenine methylase
MTTYQGGKKRLGEKISQSIRQIEEQITSGKTLPYFEPFVGMGGVLRHFSKDGTREVYACDINTDLIMMWKAIQNDWKPPLECSKEKYEELKLSNISSPERGYLGVVASWSGIFFSSYRLDYNPQNPQRDFLGEGYRGIMNIKPDIMTVNFLDSRNYYDFEPRGMLIYCDPPYLNNKFRVKYFTGFNHDKFWQVMRNWSKNNIVVISESTAPDDFIEIWSADSTFTNIYKTKKYKDCLFMYKKLPVL